MFFKKIRREQKGVSPRGSIYIIARNEAESERKGR